MTMRAIRYRRYGSPDVLDLVDVAIPVPEPGEVLVRVHAASVNPLDWHFMRASPAPIRIMTGLFGPKDGRLGVDVAGVVESVGSNVDRFRPGDEVFGAARGSVADYVSARADRLAAKPANVTFEQAAAVPVAGITALQGLRDKGRLQKGRKVLVIGAAGGVGTFAVQIAKDLHAEVTGVCSGRNVEMVASIGAGHVIDYTREDFADGDARYDVIFDCIGDRSLAAYRRVMNRGGIHVGVGGAGGVLEMLASFVSKVATSPFVSQRFVTFVASIRGDDLDVLAGMIGAGSVTPVVDRVYPIEEAADAVRYLEEGHARGKVVIRTRGL